VTRVARAQDSSRHFSFLAAAVHAGQMTMGDVRVRVARSPEDLSLVLTRGP